MRGFTQAGVWGGVGLTISPDGLTLTSNGGASSTATRIRGLDDLAQSSGKWYWEVERTGPGDASLDFRVGVVGDESDPGFLGNAAHSAAYLSDGRVFQDSTLRASGLATATTGTIVGVALDLDIDEVAFYIDGVLVHTQPFTRGTSTVIAPAFQLGQNYSAVATFEADQWVHTPPTGFVEYPDSTPAPIAEIADFRADISVKNEDSEDNTIVSKLAITLSAEPVQPVTALELSELDIAFSGSPQLRPPEVQLTDITTTLSATVPLSFLIGGQLIPLVTPNIVSL